jgi:hypothetical protein
MVILTHKPLASGDFVERRQPVKVAGTVSDSDDNDDDDDMASVAVADPEPYLGGTGLLQMLLTSASDSDSRSDSGRSERSAYTLDHSWDGASYM